MEFPEHAYVQPIYRTIQKMALYETKTRFYIIGSNNTQTKFRVLKIDRTEPHDLIVIDDKIEYTPQQMKDMLNMIQSGNKNAGIKSNIGLIRNVSAFGIVGFVRFLEGYYLILITKRRQVAKIGFHSIYKIEDTYITYIPNTGDKHFSSEESRYVKTFLNVDLSSNFYFSYSYDLTHTLQYNMSPFKKFPSSFSEEYKEEVSELFTIHESSDKKDPTSKMPPAKKLGATMKPEWKFVWNEYLLQPVMDLHPEWKLYIVHGFVGQSNISIYGKPLFLTLIGRRSKKFAGTRFLKRGSNLQGDVANEVETEQILHDSSISSLHRGLFSSFVQMRGSVPFQWSQDVSKMVPKPQITMDSIDPYCQPAGQHFSSLLRQYGAPIIALNLVKKREQKPHESILTDQYLGTISYLNQFLAPEFHIEHIGFDMARVNKLKEASVMSRLSDISAYVMKRVGFFQTWACFHSFTQGIPHKTNQRCCFFERHARNPSISGFIQTGIVRVNCVDCLDRTNTAQFALGKCALAFQLHAMGYLDSPSLQFDSDIVRMLEELYEDHGDTLALQYGGSQLVHRIKTYRKIAPLSSHSRDIMQTLSRYYSNTFSDADKQNAINLFLGVYQPFKLATPLWELSTDYYLHNPEAAGRKSCCRTSLTCWYGDMPIEALPLPINQAIKGEDNTVEELFYGDVRNEKLDGFYDFYKPYELTTLADLFSYTVSHSVRDFMPNFTTDFSPFSVRTRIGKRKEIYGWQMPPPNPSVSGVSSSSSGNSETDSGGESDEDNRFLNDYEVSSSSESSTSYCTFKTLFPTMKKTYGVEITEPSDMDRALYKRYIYIGQMAGVTRSPSSPTSSGSSRRRLTMIQQSAFPMDTSYNVTPPTVNRKSKDIYRQYVQRGHLGPSHPPPSSMVMYQQYFSSKFG